MPSPPSSAVLVLDADMTPALAVTRSLGKQGLRVDVAAHEQNPLAGYSRYARAVRIYPNPLTQREAFADWLRQQLDGDQYQLVFPVTERTATALLPLLRDETLRERIALPDPDVLELALDKHKTMQLAAELGVTCPKSWQIESLGDLQGLPDDLTFPVVVKPARSIGDNGEQAQQLTVAYAHNHDELASKAKHQLVFGAVLVQEYIQGDSVGIEVIADRGEIQLAFQHKRLHEVPLTGGGSSLRESVAVTPSLLDAAEKLMRAMHWHGVAMVEFKYSPQENRYALMEINGRFWGSLPLGIAAGADFPALLYELLTEGSITTRPKVRLGVLARKLSSDIYWHELVLRRAGDPSIVEFPPKGRLIKDLLLVFSPRHNFDVQQVRDWKPGLIDLRNIFREQWERVSGLLHRRRELKRQQADWQAWQSPDRLQPVKDVLFLCYGNINRSAIAQRLFEHQPAAEKVGVESAGFHPQENRPSDPVMRKVAAESGLDMEHWQSRLVTREMVDRAQLIFVMELSHLERLHAEYPQSRGRTLLLGMLPGCQARSQAGGEIDDPYGEAPEVYANCFAQVNDSVSKFSDLLSKAKS